MPTDVCFIMEHWLGIIFSTFCNYFMRISFIFLCESVEDKNEVVRGQDHLNELEDWSKVEYEYNYDEVQVLENFKSWRISSLNLAHKVSS